MNTEEKLLKLKKLADAMYYAAQNLTTDASRLHKAMDEYHKFIIYEYHKEEPVSEDLEEAAEDFCEGEWDGLHDNGGNPLYTQDYLEYTFKAGANWREEQLMAKAVEVEISDNGCTKGLQFIPVWPFTDEYVGGDKVKLIIIMED